MNITARNSEGGLSTLVPTNNHFVDAEMLIVLDAEGDELFRGTPEECDAYMLAEGIRPHCNCEVIDPYPTQWTGYSTALGWDSF